MVRVGIIGLGGIVDKHAEAIAALDNVEVVAVADLFEDVRTKYMEKWGKAKGYATHTELLRDDSVDAVAITLGHQLHHRLTVDACNAGKHVLVEKPMALTLQQCDEMIAAADANQVKLMVGHTQHFYGTSLKAKEILHSGQLGPLMSVICYMSKNWNYARRRPQYRSRYHGGGMWLTNGVHVVDRLLWLLGTQARSVSACLGTRAHYQASDDTGTALIRGKNGVGGVAIACGYADGAPSYESHVIGANGSLRFSQHGEKFVKLGTGDKWADVPFDDPQEEFHHEWRSFVEAIENDLEPPSDGVWGRHVMEVLFAAEQSSITGQEVVLESGSSWIAQSAGTPVGNDQGWY
jgi:phthalate 4,5-cis-dihydrodiol dehydrogenase